MRDREPRHEALPGWLCALPRTARTGGGPGFPGGFCARERVQGCGVRGVYLVYALSLLGWGWGWMVGAREVLTGWSNWRKVHWSEAGIGAGIGASGRFGEGWGWINEGKGGKGELRSGNANARAFLLLRYLLYRCPPTLDRRCQQGTLTRLGYSVAEVGAVAVKCAVRPRCLREGKDRVVAAVESA